MARPTAQSASSKNHCNANTERLGLVRGAQPTRSWKPGRVWVARDGIFPKAPKCLSAYAPFESSLEALAHLLLSTDSRIHSYVCQPPPLQYWTPNESGGQDKREYTPDFIALTRDGNLLVLDAKAARFAKDEKWLKREPYIRAAYKRDHEAELVVWTEAELMAEPRLTNARTMYRHRFAPANRNAELAVATRLERTDQKLSIGFICDEVSLELGCEPSEVFGSLMRMALEGWISLGSDRPYDAETLVSSMEIV